MAKFGFNERRLFFISETAYENLASTPSADADTGEMLFYFKLDHAYLKKPTVAEVLLPEDGDNIGTGAELFKQKTTAALLEFRTLVSSDNSVTITQNANEIDLTVGFSDIYIVQTTNATPTTVASLPLLNNRMYEFNIKIVARRSDATGRKAAFKLTAAAYRESAGVATLLGSIKQDFKNTSGGAIDANITVSGSNLIVQVTGIAAETIEWKAYVEILESN